MQRRANALAKVERMNNGPLPIPADFDYDTYMLARTTEYGIFHESRRAARFAAELIENGSESDRILAAHVLDAVLACQERDTNSPHHGNFFWMREDSVVEDLNAVEFVLEALIPMLLRHRHRLPTPLQSRVLESIQLGLGAIGRLDVHVAYTNIAALDILNTCLGGELLSDPQVAQRGYDKLSKWIEFTNSSGHPFEYNSPTYTAVTIRAFRQLALFVADSDTRIRPRTMLHRLAISVALHLHPTTGRWAGPHSRAYQPSIVGETAPEHELLAGWIQEGIVPAWLSTIPTTENLPFQVVETASRDQDLSFTTYLEKEYALGIAHRSFHDQSNVCIAHYHRPSQDRPGVLYTRFVTDDKWFGDSYHRTDRSRTRNLPDEGSFIGCMESNRAMGVYALTSQNEAKSAKLALIWTRLDQIDSVWVGTERKGSIPCPIDRNQTVVVGSGDAMIAVRPMVCTLLGKHATAQLAERNGDLVLEYYLYQGTNKRFWELNWPGAFFQGWPICAFYIEMAKRSDYPSAAEFAADVDRGDLDVKLDAPYTYTGTGERGFRAVYHRQGRELGLELDIMNFKARRRWTHEGDLDSPMLESPFARQCAGGKLTLGAAQVEAANGPIWLAHDSHTASWHLGYTGQTANDITLTVPGAQIRISGMGLGTAEWSNNRVEIDALGQPSVEVNRS